MRNPKYQMQNSRMIMKIVRTKIMTIRVPYIMKLSTMTMGSVVEFEDPFPVSPPGGVAGYTGSGP